jgi:hypothetical protein
MDTLATDAWPLWELDARLVDDGARSAAQRCP